MTSSETSREMDPESLETVLLRPAIPAPRNVLRSAILFLRAGHIFYSKAGSDEEETLESPGVAATQENSPTHQVCIDVPDSDEVGNATSTSDIKRIHDQDIAISIVKGRDLNDLHESLEMPAPMNVMRSAILFVRAGHIFYSKAGSDEEETLDSPGVLLLSPSRKNLELAAIQENSPTHRVSLDVPRNDEVGNATSNIKLVHENIASIVTGRDLDSLHAFGGVRGIAEALGTDLESGIDGEGEDLRRRRANAEYKTPVPAARIFLELLMKSSNRYTIFLLIVSAALSLGFGIKEEGPGTGWYEGVLIILAIIILVIVPAVRDFVFVSSQL